MHCPHSEGQTGPPPLSPIWNHVKAGRLIWNHTSQHNAFTKSHYTDHLIHVEGDSHRERHHRGTVSRLKMWINRLQMCFQVYFLFIGFLLLPDLSKYTSDKGRIYVVKCASGSDFLFQSIRIQILSKDQILLYLFYLIFFKIKLLFFPFKGRFYVLTEQNIFFKSFNIKYTNTSQIRETHAERLL